MNAMKYFFKIYLFHLDQKRNKMTKMAEMKRRKQQKSCTKSNYGVEERKKNRFVSGRARTGDLPRVRRT